MASPRRCVSLVIPVYYNAASLPELHRELGAFEQQLAQRDLELELIFVNDGSGDDSLAELLKIKAVRPQTKVISLSRNFGAIAASKTGFQFVTGDAFIIVAADLQDPIDQVILMVDEWLAGHKFVVSARVKRADPPFARLLAWVYYRILELMVVKGYPRSGADLMLMDKTLLPYLKGSTKGTNPGVYAFWLGFEPRTLFCERRERRHGKSRFTLRKKLKYFIDTVSAFSVTPIRALSTFGAIVALLSFVYGVSIIVAALFGNVEVRGFATLAVLISFFSGLILIMLGALGEYLWRVFDAVSNKPESVIDETFL